MISIARAARMMVWIGGWSLVASLPLAAQQPGNGARQQPANRGGGDEQMELRLYDVSFLREPQSGLVSGWLGQASDDRGVEIFGGVGRGEPGSAGFGGGSGGKGGMGGGGMFQVPDHIRPQLGGGGMGGGMRGMGGGGMPVASTRSAASRVDQVILLITQGVDPDSWDYVGGIGTLTRVGDQLGIYQTLSAHARIESLLEELRRRLASQRSVEVELRLVTIDPQQARDLSQADEQAWNDLASHEQAVHLSVRCRDGQRASIAAGVRRSYIVKAVPVVGGNVQSENSTAYSPIVITPLVGVYGQILPQVMQRPEGDLSAYSAEIDLGIILANAPGEVASAVYGTGETIDRLELQTAELETSLVATENEWVLAGVTAMTDGTSNITAGEVLPHLAVLAKWRHASAR